MKHAILLLFLLNYAFAQNLVINPGFQVSIGFPSGPGQADKAYPYWSNAGTPDFFSDQATNSNFGIPVNMYGIQPNMPAQRNYFGIAIKGETELIAGLLSDTLQSGQEYTIKMWVSLSESSTVAVVDPFYLGLHDSRPDTNTGPLFPPPLQLVQMGGGVINDQDGWTLIESTFTLEFPGVMAFTFGNHVPQGTIQTVPLGIWPMVEFGYYYIERLEIGLAGTLSRREERTALPMYPNPANDWVYINGDAVIYDSSGRMVAYGNDRIFIGDLAKGVYLARSGNQSGRFIKD